MKKNRMMRLASFLLVAVLLTSSIISGTFAKYVTEGELTDSARVAKFGVTVTGSGALFAKNYYVVQSGASNAAAPDDTEDTSNVVLSVEASEKVVAPGTNSGNGATFTITGQPEVDVEVTFDIKINEEVFLKAEHYPDLTTAKAEYFDLTDDYYPIVFTLKQGDNVLASGTSNEIADALKNATVYYDAGTDLSQTAPFTLTWEWAFEQTDADLYDKADTLLGDIAAGTYSLGAEYCNLTVDVEFTVTVTQVD